MQDLTLTSIESSVLDEFTNLIRSIWLLTSDFLISDQEMEQRAIYWIRVLGEGFFDNYGKYVPYLIKQACRDRSFRGAIHADEFYRMFCRVVLERQVYSFRRREWISEIEAMEAILAMRTDLADDYRLADAMQNQPKADEILDQCRAIIYGWEE